MVARSYPCIARPPGRARIETDELLSDSVAMAASPGHPAGRGLKHQDWAAQQQAIRASPGHPAGRGLKRIDKIKFSPAGAHRPATRPGAD